MTDNCSRQLFRLVFTPHRLLPAAYPAGNRAILERPGLGLRPDERRIARTMGFTVPGEFRLYRNDQLMEAKAWISESFREHHA